MSHSKKGRIEAIDLARGIAVTLMILSHGVKGLLTFDQIPQWGLVPIHLITKFSSTLFILVFGVALSVVFIPYIGSEKWKEKRQKLLVRGLIIFFWYKVLTIIEMMNLYSREDIIATLTYRAFPVYVEILGFYAIALLWVPFVLPAWKKIPLWSKFLTPFALVLIWRYLYANFDFWGNETLRTILVESEEHYAWGQLARAPLIFGGLVIGEFVARHYWKLRNRLSLSLALMVSAAVFFIAFYVRVLPETHQHLVSIAMNEGKHPPELNFMLFSLGGALGILALSLLGGEKLASILRPITTIGKDALQSFIFHIFVLFVFYRFLFDYWHSVSYQYALILTAVLIGLTSLWIKLSGWVREKS